MVVGSEVCGTSELGFKYYEVKFRRRQSDKGKNIYIGISARGPAIKETCKLYVCDKSLYQR
ncbi:MAG: hypothetical protein ACLUZ6_02565 [Lachnospira eligens]